MGLDPSAVLVDCLHEVVSPHGFKRFNPLSRERSIPWVAAWKRKTWNTNRGIGLIRMPQDVVHAREYALSIRKAVGKAIGYVPFLYELGLQLILCGEDAARRAEGLDRAVTPVNNSTVIIQSLHVVDLSKGTSSSARTWGQFASGKWIDAIELGIAAFQARVHGGETV